MQNEKKLTHIVSVAYLYLDINIWYKSVTVYIYKDMASINVDIKMPLQRV